MWWRRNKNLGATKRLAFVSAKDNKRPRFAGLANIAVLLVAAGLVFLGVWKGGEWVITRLFYENDAFVLKELDIVTDGSLQPEHIRRWAGVKTGDNLFGLDLLRVKRDLELIPFVKSAAVHRLLPNTLRVHVTERRGIAQVISLQRNSAGQLYSTVLAIDASGMLLPGSVNNSVGAPIGPWLPLITGLPSVELVPGRKLSGLQITTALELIRYFESSSMAAVADIQQIDIGAPEVLQLKTWQGADVTLGLSGFERQVSRWKLIHELGGRHGRALASLDLSVRNNSPVRWMEIMQAPKFRPKKPTVRGAG